MKEIKQANQRILTKLYIAEEKEIENFESKCKWFLSLNNKLNFIKLFLVFISYFVFI